MRKKSIIKFVLSSVQRSRRKSVRVSVLDFSWNFWAETHFEESPQNVENMSHLHTIICFHHFPPLHLSTSPKNFCAHGMLLKDTCKYFYFILRSLWYSQWTVGVGRSKWKVNCWRKWTAPAFSPTAELEPVHNNTSGCWESWAILKWL